MSARTSDYQIRHAQKRAQKMSGKLRKKRRFWILRRTLRGRVWRKIKEKADGGSEKELKEPWLQIPGFHFEKALAAPRFGYLRGQKASPSKGLITWAFRIWKSRGSIERAGASAISVLTDRNTSSEAMSTFGRLHVR